MENTSSSTEKLSEALKMLDDAAKSKKAEIQDLLSSKYKNIKETFTGFDSKDSVEALKKNATEKASRVAEISEDRVKEIATEIDQNVHNNPWPYIGGAAICSLLLGYIMGRKD